jgi:hypothetical protein
MMAKMPHNRKEGETTYQFPVTVVALPAWAGHTGLRRRSHQTVRLLVVAG